ncbi:ATP-binding cassette domain-containing protein [Alphaproteobacteria bacterium]|nr:ATP-binding cassette domain-containing protein [Alphaproteobacteria bacterium]
MLRIEQLKFSYDQETQFCYDLSVGEGAITAIQGPSGVGKTTLLELVAGFATPASGSVKWRDQEISHLSPWERPITTVFQADNLFAHMNCQANVLIGVGAEKNPKPELIDAVDACFQRLGIAGLQSRLPAEISGGQQQRVALARALIRAQMLAKPVLLLDESFSALDWDLRAGCFDALKDLAESENVAALLVSHDERDAAYLGCDVVRLAS